MIDEYEQGQKDMLALIKDAYYKADKSEFELLLDKKMRTKYKNFWNVNTSKKE